MTAMPLPASKKLRVDSLRADPQNPRFADEEDRPTQDELVAKLWRDMAAEEIAMSIAANGFFEHEPLFVEKSGNHYVVIEGNRRFAAVRILLDDKLRRFVGAELPKISAKLREDLQELPCIVCKREEVWQYIGFKHVNGPQVWESYSKAKYIAWVHNTLKVSLDDIASRIGDQHSTVKRLYRAYMVLEQAEEDGIFQRDDRAKKHFSFSHLYTGLNYPGFQAFLGLKAEATSTVRPVPRSKSKELRELLEWLYGSKSQERAPLVRSQNPDLRQLDEALQSKNGVAALRNGLPLKVSVNIGRGDERLFREAMIAAKQALEEARSKLLTGFKGERDLKATAEAIRTLAESIYDEIHSAKRGRA